MCAWNVSVLDKEIMMRKVTFEIKRKMIQVAAFAYSNLYLGNFLDGRLYKGKWKSFCNPGMNCYSGGNNGMSDRGDAGSERFDRF